MKYLQRIIEKTFDIRQGEFTPAILLQLNIFLIILTYIVLKPTISSLFLSKFGVQQLPYAFVLLAICAGLISIFYSKAILNVSLKKMISGTLISGVTFMLVFGVLIRLNIAEGLVLYLVYIWLAIFAVFATSQFWMLTNIVFSMREAKRLFGFIGSGAIIGGILGGYLASILAQLISSENILFVAAGLLSFCIPVTNYLWKHQVAHKLSNFQKKKRLTGVSANPFYIVKKSKYLSLIAGIVGLSVIVSKLIDYQFSAIVTSRINNPDELTSFFGFWFSTFNVVSLLVQLFITRRIVGIYGVGISLMIMPSTILLGAMLILFFPLLWSAIFMAGGDGSLKNSLNRSSLELLSLPIPLDIKTRVKTFIDVFVDRGATGLAGILLIFFVKGLNIPTPYISLLIIGLIGFWAYLAFQIRLEYINSIQDKVLGKSKDEKINNFNLASHSVFGGIKKVLESGTESQVLYILKKTMEITDIRLHQNIKNLLKHESAPIRAAALQNLYFFKTPNLTEEILPLIDDPSPVVKVEAFKYLILHDPANRVSLINKYLEDENEMINGAALISLAVESRNNKEMARIFKTEQRIKEKIDYIHLIEDPSQLKTYLVSIISAAGHFNNQNLYPFILKHLVHEDMDIRKESFIAAGNTLHPYFINTLVQSLKDRESKEFATLALSNYGRELIHTFDAVLIEHKDDVELIRQLPHVAEKIPYQLSVEFLFDLLNYEDVTVRLESLKSLNNLKINYPFLNVNKKEVVKMIFEEAALYQDTLGILYTQQQIDPNDNHKEDFSEISNARKSLIDLLERRIDGILERIFRLLGLKYPPEKILPIYDGIQINSLDYRINAIEFLDNLLDKNLKRIIIPIIESAYNSSDSKSTYQNLEIIQPNELECFKLLLAGKDIKIKLAVLFLIAKLKDDKYISLLKEYANSSNIKIKTFAQNALQEIT